MPKTIEPRLLTGKQTAQAIGISSQTLDAWRKQNLVPHIRVRHVIRFDLDRVLRALRKHEIKEVLR
jgi:DNA-binding transcriptional MerR regulator